ncbi:MAG: XdhC family protein [Acidimicrobiia bacterium]
MGDDVALDVFEIARQLSERGEHYALATVVWRRGPSSGKAGYRAVITATGEVRGWVGGACAEPVVVREALQAINEGTPRLVFLGSPEELRSEVDGVIQVPISCHSEGALKIFIEPVPRGPDLVVVGRSPMVHALAALAGTLGWWTTVVDDGGSPEDWPEADRVVTTLDLAAAGVGSRSALLIATQGHYDEEALEAAVQTSAGWLGVVASHRRAETLLGYLRDRGFPDEVLAGVRAPAGLDLGHVSHEEIAVAILAELVQFKAAGGLAGNAAEERVVSLSEEATDPVCGMTVTVAGARHRTEHAGDTYYFCGAGCQASFEASHEECTHGDPSRERVHGSGVGR